MGRWEKLPSRTKTDKHAILIHLSHEEYASLHALAQKGLRSVTNMATFAVLETIRTQSPQNSKCPHGNDLTVTECDDCAEVTFSAYVAARER